MRRWINLCLGLAAVSCAGAAVYFYLENQALRSRLAAAAGTGYPATEHTSGGPDESAEAISDDAEDVGGEASPVAVTAVAGPQASRRADFRDRRDRGMEEMARRLSDADARAAIKSRMKAQMDRRFGDLFVRLGLNADQAEALRTLLAEREMVRMQSSLMERAAPEDPAAQKEARAWREQQSDAIEAGIDAILGPNGNELLQDYQRTFPQRQVAEDVSRRASYNGAPLSPETGDQLVRLLREVEKDVPVPPELRRAARNPRGELTPDVVDRVLAAQEKQDQELLARAREFLNPAQLEALADRQLDERQRTQAELNYRLRNPPPAGRGRWNGGRPR